MLRLLLGATLFLIIASVASGVVYFSLQMIDNIQARADWEVDLMRIICLFTVLLLATPSVYQAFKKTQAENPLT